jgi:Secretion system C-terminal sorting domain
MRKLNIKLFTILLSTFLVSGWSELVFAQTLQWVNTGGGNTTSTGATLYSDDEGVVSMKTDLFGNLYSTGLTSNTNFLFNGAAGAVWGAQDVFLMKTRCDGSVAWFKLIGGRSPGIHTEATKALTIDNDGSCYLLGSSIIYTVGISDSVRIGNDTIIHTVGGIPYHDQMTIIKYDSGGIFKWILTYPRTGLGVFAKSLDITFNQSDQCVYALVASGGACIPSSDSARRTYVLKYNKMGNLLSIKEVFENYPAPTDCKIVTDNAGNFYLSGTYYNPDTLIIHGGPILPEPPIISHGFICKFDTAGHFKWSKYTSDRNEFDDLAINNSGNIIAVAGTGGTPGDPLIIDTFHLQNMRGTGNGGFVVVFDSTGTIKTANISMGVRYGSTGLSLDINKKDEIAVSGVALGTVYFDTIPIISNSFSDPYFATMSATTGNFLEAKIINGTGFYDGANNICYDKRNNVYFGGYFQGNLFIPGDTFAASIRGGLTDIFIGKYGVASCLCIDASASFTESHTGHSFTYNSTSTNADSLFWIFGDGATQAGGATASHSYTTGTPHSVCVWAFNDCSKDSSCLVTTGIEGVSGLNVEVYPNPASSVLQVNNQSGKNCTLQLIDVGGKVILNSSIINGLNTIDISNYGSGIYFILLQQENNLLHYKLVVQH